MQQLEEDLFREEPLKYARHEDNTAYSQQKHPHAGSSALPKYNTRVGMLHVHMHPLPPLMHGAMPDIRKQGKDNGKMELCMYVCMDL